MKYKFIIYSTKFTKLGIIHVPLTVVTDRYEPVDVIKCTRHGTSPHGIVIMLTAILARMHSNGASRQCFCKWKICGAGCRCKLKLQFEM